MYDQSFNNSTITKNLKKSDFVKNRFLIDEEKKNGIIIKSIEYAHNNFESKNILEKFHINGKNIYLIKDISHELVIRKLYRNIRYFLSSKCFSRDFIISNLVHIISEGLPYRIYRLDIKSFYESFMIDDIINEINSIEKLSPLSKKIVYYFFTIYKNIGGTGLPRGLAISALLSNLMMSKFDNIISNLHGVYFYTRYVDDIIIITKSEEKTEVFEDFIKNNLPQGLTLNFHPKKKFIGIANKINPSKDDKKLLFSFDYLGYNFSIFDPKKNGKVKQFREVCVDISKSKLKKIKTKISRSFYAFKKDNNFHMLLMRIKYLTSNFKVKDIDKNINKLSGIYHNYSQITNSTAIGLHKLDIFLKNCILSKNDRLFSYISKKLTNNQKRLLLKHSFSNGHKNKSFIYFSPLSLKKIQECWKYE